MSLSDINDRKGSAIAVLVVESVEGRSLPPERRSSIAAEDEDYICI
jgi:hypothetical protein